MKQLHEKVNIVPVIGKADTLTPEECVEFKANVMKEIEFHDIKIYQFPVDEFDEEEEAQDLQVKIILFLFHFYFTSISLSLLE